VRRSRAGKYAIKILMRSHRGIKET
jgi:hypothetical protein